MVVEHTFVTTMQPNEALGAASSLLASRGFVPTGDRAFALDGGWNHIELTRGRKNPARSKSILDFTQQVRIEFDRGRIAMAASLTAWTRGTREQIPGELTTRSPSKPHPLQQELLLSLVAAIELLLVNRVPPEQCLARLNHIEAAIQEDARRLRRRNWIILGSVVLGFVALIALIIWGANSR
jgi:hypothetical protein